MNGSHGQARQRTTRAAYGTVLVLAFLTVAAVQNGMLGFLVASLSGSHGAPDAGLLPPRLPRPAASSEQHNEVEPPFAAPAGTLAAGAVLAVLAAALSPRRARGSSFSGRLRGAVGRVARRQAPNPSDSGGGSDRKVTVDQMKEVLRAKGEKMMLSMIEQLETEIQDQAKVSEASPQSPEVPARDEEAEGMFAQLQQLDSGSAKEDYFDSESGQWDKEGLQDDLSLAQQNLETAQKEAEAVPEAAVEEAAPARNEEAEAWLAQLQKLQDGVEKEDYYDADSGTWDLDGLQDDLELAQKRQQSAAAPPAQDSPAAPTTASAPPQEEAPGHNQRAEAMYAQLKQLDSAAQKEDYFDSESGEWDEDGLQDDLALAQQNASAAPKDELNLAQQQEQPASPAPAAKSPQAEAAGADAGGSPESMLAELMRYDSGVCKEDYYDEEADEWDLDGLRDDLELAANRPASIPAEEAEAAPAPVAAEAAPAPAAAAAADAGDGEAFALWAELTKLDSEASKEDYFDEESGEWDEQGLQDDLALARQAQASGGGSAAVQEVEQTPAPAAPAAPAGDAEALGLWAELSRLDGEASKEDYFDQQSGEWDVEGLQEDLALARQEKGSGGEVAVVPEAAPAVGSEAQAAPVQQEGGLEDPEALLALLSTFDPSVTKQDYFHDGEWDVDGLKEDLRLAREGIAASVQAAAEPEANAEEGIAVGDYVLAKYEGDGAGWYTAVVTKDQGGGSFTLKWDEDSSEETVVRKKMKLLPPIVVNAKVSAIWEGDGRWYDAVVVRSAGQPGTFVVKYDEDGSQASLSKEKIRMKAEPPSEPTYWAAPYQEGDEAPAAGEEIEACWRDGDYVGYHSAKMVKDNGDGTYLVKWDEDSSQTSMKKEEIRKYKAKVPLSELHPGKKFVGIVTNIIEAGAFVNIGVDAGSDGFVHKSRLRAEQVKAVEDVTSVGDVVTVWCSRVKEDGKYDLSMVEGMVDGGARFRQEADYSAFEGVDPSTFLKATVTGLQAYGLFVDVQPPNGSPAQRGFVHCSEIRDGYVEDAAAEAEVGQEVQVRVMEVDKEQNRLRLSMKPA